MTLAITLMVAGLVLTSIGLVVWVYPWARAWYIARQVLRNADAEQRAILLGNFSIDDFVDAPRPE